MATQISGRGGALKKADLAGNRYQGSVGSSGFQPVKAVSEEKAAKQKTQAVERESQVKQRALARKQQAETLTLQAQHKAISSKQTLDQKVEVGELKQDQLYEKSVFDLKKNWVTLNDNLKLSEMKAGHQVESTNLKTIGSIIQLSTSFAKSYLDYSSQMNEIKENAAAVKLVLEGGSAKVLKKGEELEKSHTEIEKITSEANIKGADGDLSLQNSLNQENSQTRTERIFKKKSAFEFARDFPAFYKDEWENGDLQIELEDGRVISPKQAKSAEEVLAVGSAITAEIASRYGLKDLDSEVVYRVVLPKIREARSQVDTALTASVIKGNINNSVQVEKDNSLNKLQSGEYSMQEIFDELYDGISIHGKHATDKGAITNETVQTIVDFLQSNRDLEGLEALKLVEKVKGNKGLTLGKIADTSESINSAIDAVRTYEYDQNQIRKKEDAVKVESASTTHKTELIEAGNDIEKVIAANEKYESTLKSIGSTDALSKYQTHANKDDRYNEYLTSYYLDQIKDGNRISERELEANVAIGAMTEKEKTTVMNASGLTKEGADIKLKPYQSDWGSVIEGQIIGKSKLIGIDKAAQRQIVGLVKEDIVTEVNDKMADWFETFDDNEQPTKADISKQAGTYIDTITTKKVADNPNVFSSDGVFDASEYSWYKGRPAPDKIILENKKEKYNYKAYNLKSYTADQLFELKLDDLDPSRDKIFSDTEYESVLKTASTGDWTNVDPRFKQIAKDLDLTNHQLLKHISKERGLDIDEVLKKTTVEKTGEVLNMVSGVNTLQSYGLSDLGSKQVSAILETQGQWAETNQESLGQIIEDMKTNSPDAYRIFTTPGSTSTQLRRAAIMWGGYEVGIQSNAYFKQLQTQ